LRWYRKTVSVGAEVTLGGRLFQRRLPATRMHDCQQWTALYVGSPAARMTTTGDGGGWNWRPAGCSRKDTMAPNHAGISKWAQPTWNRCVPETAASDCRSIGV